VVHLDAEEEHSVRGRQNGWAYLTTLKLYEKPRTLLLSSPVRAVVPEKFHRLKELLNLQWLLQDVLQLYSRAEGRGR
jgi:hypothetical protein